MHSQQIRDAFLIEFGLHYGLEHGIHKCVEVRMTAIGVGQVAAAEFGAKRDIQAWIGGNFAPNLAVELLVRLGVQLRASGNRFAVLKRGGTEKSWTRTWFR